MNHRAPANTGVVLSVPFYYKNLERLGTKIASGGKDSGYETKSKKLIEPKNKVSGLKAARGAFFKR